MENYLMINGVKIELTQEQLDLLNVKVKPQWENFGEVKGYYITLNNTIGELTKQPSIKFNKNVFPTKEEAEACLALSQLCQWRDKYNEGWKADWKSISQKKYCIIYCNNEIVVYNTYEDKRLLCFKTKEIRNKFLEDFSELIEIAKPLL